MSKDKYKSGFFIPENEIIGSSKEIFSTSGKYKLVISMFKTAKGSWNYSQGIIYRKDNDKPIAIVQRNYCSFPNLFIEGHSNGHDYLVCGENYQGQTIIELDTGMRRDSMSDGSDKGIGFCWSSYCYDAPNQMLTVDGCYWACPYGYKFFDFSDPINGYPEIVCEEYICVDDNDKVPEIGANGTIRCFQTRYIDDSIDKNMTDEEYDEQEAERRANPIVDVIQTFHRDGLKLNLVEEWVSDYEKDRRVKREESEKKYQEWLANFKATDILYLTYLESGFAKQHISIGYTYDGWGGDWNGKDKRCCSRIITHKGKIGATIDLEWGVETGPVKLVLYRDGKSDGHKFFEHSVEGMEQAFEFAKSYETGRVKDNFFRVLGKKWLMW